MLEEKIRREPHHVVYMHVGMTSTANFLLDLKDAAQPRVVGELKAEHPDHFVVVYPRVPVKEIIDGYKGYLASREAARKTFGKLPGE